MKRPNPIWMNLQVYCIPMLMLFCQCWFSSSCAGEELRAGNNSRRARENAVNAVPMQKLTREAQQKIRPILQRPSIYRCLPVTSIEIDPDYYLHLVRHPEVIINIWKLMGVTQMTIDRTGPYTMTTDDGVGTLGKVELLYGTNNMHIYYCEGEYTGSLLAKKLRGKCVFVMRTEYKLNDEGEKTATSQFDIFLKIDNATVGLIAKTLHPLIGSTADHNFVESINFLERLNETTVNNGPGVQGMAERLTTLTPEVKQKFVQVAGLVYDRAQGGIQNGAFVSRSNAHQSPSAGQRIQNYGAQRVHLQDTSQWSSAAGNRMDSRTPGASTMTQSIPTRSNLQNPYLRSNGTNGMVNPQGQQNQMRQAPVQATFGDQPQNVPSRNATPRPIYSTRRQPYKSNPHYSNR